MITTARFWIIAMTAQGRHPNSLANLKPGSSGHKLTPDEVLKGGKKSGEVRRINASFRQLAKRIRGSQAPESEVELLEMFGIPVNSQTVGAVIVARTAIGAMQGNRDDRRDFMRMTGDDPDVEYKEEELKLKKSQVAGKDEHDVEDLSGIWGMVHEPDADN